MTGTDRLVGLRQRDVVAQALSQGAVVGLPDVGSYVLGVRASDTRTQARLDTLATAGRHPEYLVGRTEQARRLSEEWLDSTQRLVVRCWPGPLTVLVSPQVGAAAAIGVRMPGRRALRHLLVDTGPLRVIPVNMHTAAEVASHFLPTEVAFVIDGGTCAGPGPTVVDGTSSALTIRSEGALPAEFIEAALLMGTRRRRWFRSGGVSGTGDAGA
ncbi:MAG TPA: Sua5/YciO/YrdC/YwlC family protein [Acidimicrobiales bacterium]|jgi:tRNA A37 threonylcarbamoyladenosine synthetase subunit TsaC/SUA5/YrdC